MFQSENEANERSQFKDFTIYFTENRSFQLEKLENPMDLVQHTFSFLFDPLRKLKKKRRFSGFLILSLGIKKKKKKNKEIENLLT